jgi:hypothetical protein
VARHKWIILKNFLETDWIILCLELRIVGVVTRSNAVVPEISVVFILDKTISTLDMLIVAFINAG